MAAMPDARRAPARGTATVPARTAAPAPAADLLALIRAMPPQTALAMLDGVLAELPAESLLYLRGRRMTDAAIRRCRDDERDTLYRRLAEVHGTRESRGLARVVVAELTRYRQAAWRFEEGCPAPSDPYRATMHRLLTVTGGGVLGTESVRKILAGLHG